MKCGYARVSTTDQKLDVQKARLHEAGCERVYEEKRSGTTTAGRTELETLLDFVREGDELVVTRIDRLARSLPDLLTIVETLKRKGVALKVTEQPIDTSTPMGTMFMSLLGVFAQFETEVRKERQMEGIARAKAAGVYTGGKGRAATIDGTEIIALRERGLGASEIAKRLKISRASVYRAFPAACDS